MQSEKIFFDKTIEFYNEHAQEYVAMTVSANMTKAYKQFLKYLPSKAKILDAGCGSGRDSLYFIQKGYDVIMIDASVKMCRYAEQLTGQKALNIKFKELNNENYFDGIWACASLLHISEKDLEQTLDNFYISLKNNGILYASWKYGENERQDGERFYCDMTEAKLEKYLQRIKLFKCVDYWFSEDVLSVKRKQKWLNVILTK